jgi:hypothetical protein
VVEWRDPAQVRFGCSFPLPVSLGDASGDRSRNRQICVDHGLTTWADRPVTRNRRREPAPRPSGKPFWAISAANSVARAALIGLYPYVVIGNFVQGTRPWYFVLLVAA